MMRTFSAFAVACLVASLAACASDGPASPADTDVDAGVDTGDTGGTDGGGTDGGGTDTGGEDTGGTDTGGEDTGGEDTGGEDAGGEDPFCGDGIVQAGEICDDGDDNADDVPDACRLDCTPARCGDSVVDSGEECDDGNANDDDFCTSACVRVATDLCRPCSVDDNCGGEFDGCVALEDGNRCGLACRSDRECPDGFVCSDVRSADGAPIRHCVPASGVCTDCFDPDRDGFGTGAGCEASDCDQNDPDIYPGAEELCDGIDNDCDGAIDNGIPKGSFYPDADRDGRGDRDATPLDACRPPAGYVDNADDCDDSDPFTYVGAPELCDERDNDCDSDIDEETDTTDFFVDADGDGFGDADADPVMSCEPIEGSVTNNDDCNDGNGLVRPDAEEACGNGIDDNCDGDVDCDDAACADTPACTSGCEDDAFEDNDTRGAATPIAGGEFEGLVSCEGDDDFFRLDLSAGDALEVELTFSDAEGDIDLTLVDAEGRVVAASVSTTDDESFGLTVATSGTYYLRVRLFADTGSTPGNDYLMFVEITEGASPCRDDDDEDNDTRAAATDLGAGTVSDRVACPGDPDWYVFEVGAEDEITLTAAFADAEGDIDLRLFDGDGRLVASSLSTTDDESVSETVLRGGTWAVSVELFGDAGETPGNTYDLTFDLVSAGPRCDTDEFEPNDNRDAARPMMPGAWTDLIVCDGDDDWYAITLGRGDELTARVSFSLLDGDVDLRLFAPSGDLVAESRSLFGSSETVRWTAETSGVFLLRVNQAIDPFGDSTDYDMTIDVVEAPSACTDDASEDNDDVASATRLTPGAGAEATVCPDDADFWAFEVEEGQEITVDAVFVDADGDVDLALLDPDGVVIDSSFSVTDDEQVTATASMSGTYVARVTLFGADEDGNDYLLDVTLESPALTCDEDDRFEENDDRDSARFPGTGRAENLIACDGDADWYLVYLIAGDTLTWTVEFTDAEGDIDIFLYDEDETEVAFSDGVEDDEILEYTTETSGFFYLEVDLVVDAGDPGNAYAMEYTIDDGE